MGVNQLEDEARLPHSRLPDDGGDLAPALTGLLEGTVELLHLGIPAHETGEPANGRCLKPRTHGADSREFVDLDRSEEALHGHGTEGGHLHEAFGEREGIRSQEDRARVGELLHSTGKVSGLPYRRVVHVEIGADRANDHLARVQTYADPDRDAVLPSHSLGVPGHGLLHAESGITSSYRVVLERERRAEQRHDPVPHHLIDRALVAVDGLHHAFEDGIEQLARLLGVTVGEQFHRTLEIREEDGHLLALAFHRDPRGKDLLGDVFGGIRLGASEATRWLGGERGAAGSTELFARRDGGTTTRAGRLKPGATVLAEATARVVLSLAAGTPHSGASK